MSPRTGSNLVWLVGERCGERGGVVHSMGQHGASCASCVERHALGVRCGSPSRELQLLVNAELC